MSTASAAPAAAAPAPRSGKKKLLIIVAVVALLLVIGGGAAAFVVLKNRAAAEAAAYEDDEQEAAARPGAPRDLKHVPTFLPLDPFTVNLADRNADRYAQITMSLQLSSDKQADLIKAYMPVVRNNILMLLSHKTAEELLERDGKATLAKDVQRETARALGYEVDDEAEPSRKRRRRAAELPVTAVHFATFIIQ